MFSLFIAQNPYKPKKYTFFMQKVVLVNGLKILFEEKKSSSVVVEVMINVGSNQEEAEERGLSHFLEHILFEGTTKRPTNQLISQEIEKIGGELNAYTSNERTCFYAKVLKKHFTTAVEVLADILQNPLFKETDIKREKKIVLKEIDMVLDEPRFYQWILLQKYLFTKHTCRYPTYGDKSSVLKISRERLLQYYQKYYVPNNMTISIVGEVKNWKKIIENQFRLPGTLLTRKKNSLEPSYTKTKIIREHKKISNTYLALGFKTVSKKNHDAYVLEIINTLLGRGQSGRLFTEIRSRQGLAYDVGTQHIAEVSYGYFAAYACVDKKNVDKAKKLILKELQKLKSLSLEDLAEAKVAIEGEYYLDLEDSQRMADQLLFWEQAQDAHLLKRFIKNIRKVKKGDVKRVVEKYFKNYVMIVLEG